MKSGWANRLRGIVALALLMGAAPSRAQTPQAISMPGDVKEEPNIVAIRIVQEDGQVLSEFPSGIAVDTGKALDREKIAESLRALYRTGDYADLKAVVTPVADGVRLDFVVRENLFFNQVRIEGLSAPPSGAASGNASDGRCRARKARPPRTRRHHPTEERHGVSRCRNPLSLENESGKR